ncbi:MAG: hypothetical protein AAGF12_26770 [Myxococcota bacterium]
MRSRVLRLLHVSPLLPWILGGAALVSVALSIPAQAQDAEGAPVEAEATAPRTPPYLVKVAEGVRAAVAGSHDGALAKFEEATREDPSRPEAYYHSGAVERIRRNLTEALQHFRDCIRTATGRDDVIHARCLQAIADTLEMQEDGLEQAREAWQEYQRFADGHQMAADIEMGRARIQRIDMVLEQERVYVDVRQRIADRERENASGNNRNDRNNRRRQNR